MPFVKGQSGNSKGRPPKARALTATLEAAGSATVDVDGQRFSGKRLVAQLIWQLVTTGKVILPGGAELTADTDEWLQAVKWIYAQVDGPPKTEIGLEGALVQVTITADDLTEARARALAYETALLEGTTQ